MPIGEFGVVCAMLVDHQALMRQTISFLLASELDITIVAEAADGVKALGLAHDIKPNLVIMNLMTPKLDGLRVTELLHKQKLVDHVLLFCQDNRPTLVRRALDSGAKGYLVTSALQRNLVTAIHTVCRGEIFVSTISDRNNNVGTRR